MESNLPGTSNETVTSPAIPITPPSINQPPEQSIPTRPKKKLFIIISIILLLGIIITAGILYAIFSKPKTTATQKETAKEKTDAQDVKTYPKFQFTYGTLPPLANPKTQLQSYVLKSAFSESELASFGAKFGFPGVEKKQNGFAHYSDFKNPQTRGFLVFDTRTGAFEFTNLSLEQKVQTADIKQGAKEFLASIGLTDNLADCSITYKSSVLPDVTYVECHRPWEVLGAPLLNLPGVMNIPENKPLSDIKLGYNDTPLENPTIIDVSTGQNGVNRPNDFNTATFAIAKDGTILSLTSNLRWIESSNQSALITPSEALTAFTQNKAAQTVVIPAGNGNFDWNKVFPEKGVTGKNAQIKDYQLIYVENEPGQSQNTYTPMYLIRGNVMLDTGYSVNFVQTVPATTNSTASLQVAQGSPRNNLQLQTFTTKATPTSAAPTLSVTKTLTPTPSPRPFDCSVDLDKSIKQVTSWNKLITFTVKINGANVTMATLENAPNVFFINEKATTSSEVSRYRSEMFNLIGRQFAWNYKNGAVPNSPDFTGYPSGYGPTDQARAAVQGIYDSLIKSSAPIENPNLPTLSAVTALSMDPSHVNNPCYLTGLSPTIFLYSENQIVFTVSPSSTVYSDPKLMRNSWIVKTNKNGALTFENFTKDFLYYEFDPAVTFEKQNDGFVVKRLDLQTLVHELASTMKLNEKETSRLRFEFNHALNRVNETKQYIKVSLIPAAELTKKLPLLVQPKPEHINRYHFLLEGIDSNIKIKKPEIPAVTRGKSTLIEIGASGIK